MLRALSLSVAGPQRALAAVLIMLMVALAGCSTRNSLLVTATAYNSVRGQTQGNPNIAAWGDELKPGMKVVAVSRDLLERGLTRGTRVRIEGLPGDYVVLDKMHPRWTRKIDVYMGKDVQAARRFGQRKLRIWW